VDQLTRDVRPNIDGGMFREPAVVPWVCLPAGQEQAIAVIIYLGAFAKLPRATIGFVVSVRP